MKPPDEREEVLFREALQRSKGPEREAFLNQVCAGNEALRARLDALLQAHERPDPFLEPQPAPAGKTVRIPPREGPGTLIGRYKLLEQVGEGGFGVVYVAEQREPVKRRVALKIIKLGMDTKQVVARFEAERQALALMDHPNIAKVLDAGATDTGRPYFVMELVKGIPITHYCDQEKLGTRERLDLFIQVCHAIQHAHQKGIIHRDIKPSNILVTLHDGVPVPKVIDFGIAKATQQELTEKTVYTQFQQFIGTPAYMSPEQAEMSGLDIDTRSDIYSLGVLLYELLTGSTPFDTKELLQSGLDEMRKIIREREPVRPSTRLRQTATLKVSSSQLVTRHSSLATDLDWIVMKCLEKDRTRRYDTANGVAQDVERHLKHEPVVARPPSVGYRLQKSFRRNRLVFTAAGLVGLALVLGILGSSWQAVRASRAEKTAREETSIAEAERQRASEAARVAESQRERAETGEQRAKESEAVARESLYAADMSLAYRAWQENNLGVALELLNQHRPMAGQPDLRGWEWRYLWGACRSEERYSLTTFLYAVGRVAISPDGKLLVAAGNYYIGGGGVTLWEIASKKLITTPEADDASGSVAFSPNGKLLAFGTVHHGVKLWDIAEGREIHRFPGKQFASPALGLGFSPDGRTLAVYRDAGQIVLWELEHYTPLRTLAGPLSGTSSLTFRPDGQTLVSASVDRTIRLWSVATGQQFHCFTNLTEAATFLTLSPDGKTLASASWDGSTIRLWDPEERRQLKELTNHTAWVSSLAFSPDGKTLASGSADYTIKLWDTISWEEVDTLRGSLHEVWGLAFSRDGKLLFSGAKDGTIKAWDATPRVRTLPVLSRPADAENFYVFRDSGITVAWHSNHTLTLWERGTLRRLGPYATPPLEILTNALGTTLSQNGDRLAVATSQGAIVIWDLPGERLIRTLDWVRTEPDPSQTPFESRHVGATSPNGKRLCFVAPHRLTVWNLETFEEVATLPKSAAAPVPGTLCFANDGESIAVANYDRTVEVWSVGRKQHFGPWVAHRHVITGTAFVRDGKILLTSSEDTTIKLWNVETSSEVRPFARTENAYFSAAVSPDGTRVAAGSAVNVYVRIWNAATGQEVALLKGLHGSVRYLAFLADGNTLVSGSDQEVRLWRAPSWAEIEAAEARERAEARQP